MQCTKISCASCPHYDTCSKETKLFVNYCGSQTQYVKQQIQNAVMECRAKQGPLFKSAIFRRIVKAAPAV